MVKAREEKGITLIELIVTITILLILVGITGGVGINATLELKRYNAVKSDIIELT